MRVSRSSRCNKLDARQESGSGRRLLSILGSVQAWYNLGLAQRAGNDSKPLASFEQASKLDPSTMPILVTFEGVCYQEMRPFDKAIVASAKGARTQSTSCLGGICYGAQPAASRQYCRGARALQGFSASDRRQDFFGHGLSYGEQGRYSTVTPVLEPESIERTMIPVKLEAQPLLLKTLLRFGGSVDDYRRGLHDGCDRLRADGPGADAIGCAGHPRPPHSRRRQPLRSGMLRPRA